MACLMEPKPVGSGPGLESRRLKQKIVSLAAVS